MFLETVREVATGGTTAVEFTGGPRSAEEVRVVAGHLYVVANDWTGILRGEVYLSNLAVGEGGHLCSDSASPSSNASWKQRTQLSQSEGREMDNATLQFVEFKDRLDAHIRAHAMPRNAVSPIDVLRRWTFLSEQFPRFLGAILSRISSPSAQCLVAKNITGECGNGIKEEMHSLLLANMVRSALGAEQMRFPTGPFQQVIDRKLDEISKMSAGEAIGLLIGLEAPAYDILALLRRSLVQVGMTPQTVDDAPYMRIHQEVEKVHQDDSLAIAEMVRELGCPDAEIIKGGDSAVEFWSAWWAAAY